MPESNQKPKKDPKVVVFGNEIGDEEKIRFHHHRHGSFSMGLLFIFIGFLFLLSNFGSLPPIAWSQIIRLWPVLIILIGIKTIFGHSDVSDIISSIISIVIFGTILGVILIQFAPNTVSWLPTGVYNYLHSIYFYLQPK